MRRRNVLLAALSIFLLTQAGAQPAQQKKLKVYISVDMEGIGGVVTGSQLGPGGFEYERFRQFMTREALAAVNAAKEAGATEILVSDSHGNGENLLIDQFPVDVRIIRAWPRKLSMMAGIDATFDAVIFIGYHSSTTNPRGVRAHTFSSGTLTRVAANDVPMTEASWNAAIAGHFGVPVVMIAGDDAVIAEARSLLGNIEGAEVKRSLGFHSASTLTPQAAAELVGQKVKAALGRLKDFKPYTLAAPIRVDVSFKHYRAAEALSYMPGVERLDAHSARFTAKDMLQASDFMVAVTNYNSALEP
jgi:D-amino peptidase